MEWYVTIGLILTLFCVTVFGDDYCYIDETSQWESCEEGCCGRNYQNNRRCCSETDVLVWIIVGSVVGGLLLISFIVAVVCCFIKSKGKKGRVVNPTGPQGQTMVYTTRGQQHINHYNVYPTAPPYPAASTYPTGPIAPPAYMAAPPAYSQGPSKQNQYPQQNFGQPHLNQQYGAHPPPYRTEAQNQPANQPADQPTNQQDGQVPGPSNY